MTVRDKVAIVTGAGQGIGLEICRKLVENGAKVILNDVSRASALEAASGLSRDHCVAVPGDSSRIEVIDELIRMAADKFGRLDIAIANAGITLFGDFFSYPVESFNRVMQVNQFGSFYLAQAAAKRMREQGDGGSILFTSSVTGNQAHKQLAAYSMTKAALQMLAKNLVVEVSQYRINVNTIAPGATVTERTLADEPEYEGTWSGLTPMGRPAYVHDIANAALFLVSEESRHITGQTLIIDGGWSSISPSPF